jgi:hypothetical protein
VPARRVPGEFVSRAKLVVRSGCVRVLRSTPMLGPSTGELVLLIRSVVRAWAYVVPLLVVGWAGDVEGRELRSIACRM